MQIDPRTSQQIAILRPICIFFMMSVHINPGWSVAAHDGAMRFIGLIEVEVLGRASVSALSLISGYLLAMVAERQGLRRQIAARVKTLYVPMLTWNAIFLMMGLGAFYVAGIATTTGAANAGAPLHVLVLKRVMFLYGEPASLALGFLRDLAVSSALLALAVRHVRLLWLLPVVLALTLAEATAPIIYRPSILLFMTAGAVLWQKGRSLTPPAWTFPLAFLTLWAILTGEISGDAPAGEAAILIKRLVLTVVVLALASAIVGSRTGRWLAHVSDGVYLAFLSHTTVMSALWAILPIDVRSGAYLVWFLTAPLLCLTLALLAGPLISQLPAPAQVALRGKAL